MTSVSYNLVLHQYCSIRKSGAIWDFLIINIQRVVTGIKIEDGGLRRLVLFNTHERKKYILWWCITPFLLPVWSITFCDVTCTSINGGLGKIALAQSDSQTEETKSCGFAVMLYILERFGLLFIALFRSSATRCRFVHGIGTLLHGFGLNFMSRN